MQRWMQAAMIRGERHGYAMHGLTPTGQVFEGEFNHTTPKPVRVKEAAAKVASTKAERRTARRKLADRNKAYAKRTGAHREAVSNVTLTQRAAYAEWRAKFA